MLRKLLEKLAGGNTLYYPGCMTRCALPGIQARYEALLRRAGVDFIVLPGEVVCCGSPVKRAGYMRDFEELKKKNLALFARFSVRRIVTNCPGCYHTLKEDYGLDALHVSQVLSPRRRPAQGEGQSDGARPAITYHDPCHLGRWSGIFEEPRRLLEGAGWQVAELPQDREQSLCCGAGGGVKSNFPELANAVARARLAQVSNGRLCTTCPLCYAHFKENAGEIEVLELSEILTADSGDGGSR